MSRSPATALENANARLFGLRIESHLLQVAIATPIGGVRYRLEIDDIACSSSSGWLTPTGSPLLIEALATLADRHNMQREQVAVSLDGDFCVTRVATGTADEVDRELAMLADRVPRYLQLGPGEKVTGGCRLQIAPGVDYAVTGIVNRTLIQLIYDALRATDIEVRWVEPSLVGLARLVGQAKWGDGNPIMIADGTGNQWDVGLAYSDRLLLDYRPAAATSEEAFRDALDGHVSRLRRFCHRHRGIASGDLNQLLICGSGEKLDRTVAAFADSRAFQPTILKVPELDDLYEISDQQREARCVPAVATVLPLLMSVPAESVPDLLTQVRRAPDRSWLSRAVQCCWPAVAAVLLLCLSYGLVSGERRQAESDADHRQQIESQIRATRVRLARLAGQRELMQHLTAIQRLSGEPSWDSLLERITQTLPDTARLTEYRVETGGLVRLDGIVLDESIVYEFVGDLRRLPAVTQVALQGTNPEAEAQGTRFSIQLSTQHRGRDRGESGATNE